jgi:hypothetical protein
LRLGRVAGVRRARFPMDLCRVYGSVTGGRESSFVSEREREEVVVVSCSGLGGCNISVVC